MKSALQQELIGLEGLPLYAGISWLILVITSVLAVTVFLVKRPKLGKKEPRKNLSTIDSKGKGF